MNMSRLPREHRTVRARRSATAALAVVVGTVLVIGASSAVAGSAGGPDKPGKEHWNKKAGKLPPTQGGAKADVTPEKAQALTLDRNGLAAMLAGAPAEAQQGAKQDSIVISLPDPSGSFQSFAVHRSELMAPGLAEQHPEIQTFSGVGVDDPAATVAADLSPLGFHASVRAPDGAWYIDPYYHLEQSVYASYYGRDVKDSAQAPFVERDADAAEVSVDEGYYHAADTVTVSGNSFAADAAVTITISDPEEQFAARTVATQSDSAGSFTATFVADPNGDLETHIVEATDGESSASASYQVVGDDDPTSDPPTGDVLRTYRLALITDPGYAAFFGGSANVTPAKVALMNRVSQVYQDDLSIRLQLIANNDLLNLDTWDKATAPNGPCGSAACFTQAQVTGCSSTTRARFVIGQIIGASNYDIGHLALGQPGGGVANLGVIGRSNKAGGCTGIPTPVGDFYAVDYVAHEMGHQFSGNHPFNGNQLNCSGGNRNPATSVEVGSGSSIMAYAGICLTDDLQAHSDPYFSQRSLQEISTYTSSSQAAINEVQTASLRHFGGGNETQVVTFGPGYQQASTIQPLSVAIGAPPTAAQLGGASETGNTVTISTGASGAVHTLQPGDSVTIAGVAAAGYNGTFTVDSVLTSRAFTYTNPVAGLPRSGGGTVTLNAPGLSESGNTVTVRTAAAHNRSVGDIVVITGAGVAAYNGTVTVTSVTPRSFTYENPTAGLSNSGGGSATYSGPFQVRIGGNDSAVIGGTSQAYTAANVQTAINAIAGFAGTATVSGLASTGFTVTYSGASAGIDVPSFELVNLSCGGCFASVEETNHGGAADSFVLNYNGNVSVPITNGVNYTAAGILAALTPILPAGATATVAGFAGGGFNNTGFQVTFTGTLAATNVPVLLALQNFTAGASGFVGETDKGGAVDNKGGIVTPTGNQWPAVTAPAGYTIPLRTPFALTGNATDADGDGMTFSWEQNDRGAAAGTSLLSNTKANGPLFAMFPKSGQISASDTLQYNSPGQNHLTSTPTRVFPDLQQVLDNNTNAVTGACPVGPIAPPVPVPVTECFSEFLPTADYVGFTGVNATPLSLHFRFTARDGKGGVNAADTTLLLATNAGPFLVTAPNTAATWTAGSTRTVTWDVANTTAAPVNAADVKISLSTDGGLTYPFVLAASTANDGSQAVTVPNVGTAHARVKVEAVGNVFFDVSNADFTVLLPGVIGLDSVSLSGKNAVVDSFDSSAGQYGSANKGSAASLFSNGAIALGQTAVGGNVRSALGPASLEKGGLVTGDVTAGTTITNKGTINGTASPNTPTPAIAAPPVAACSFSDGAGISGNFAYTAATGDLTVSGGKTATLAAGTYCFNNLTLSGGSVMTVSGPVVIKLTGKLNGSGGSFANPTYVPANLRIESSFTGAGGVALSGGSGAYLTVYAPGTGVTLSGGSPLFGALLGKTLTASGGADIHYDVQTLAVWASYFNS